MKRLSNKRVIFWVISGFFIISILSPALGLTKNANAQEFDPAFIFTDGELQDTTSMELGDVQKFLDLKKSFLATFATNDVNGIIKTAAEIIYDAAIRHKINPRYILAVLQKEQSLVENNSTQNIQDRLDWAAGYGICDSCSKNDPTLQKFKGFGNQADYAAGANRYYFDNPFKFGFKVNQPIVVDGQKIIPRTQATVNQYIYTPHIQGNKNLWSLWKEWFTRKYPNGTVIQAKRDKTIYLIKNGTRLAFANFSSFISRFNLDEVVEVDPTELENYDLGPQIKFPNYSVLKASNGFFYLLVNDSIRPFASPKVVSIFGYNPDEIIEVNIDDIKAYKPGKFITAADAYPTGAVLKRKDTAELYYVYEGIRRPILSEYVAKNRFPNQPIIKVTKEELMEIPLKSQPIYLKDGTLVKTPFSNTIYIISDGTRRLIPTEEVFKGLGYKFENVKEIDEIALLSHPEGDQINLNTQNIITQ